MPPSNQYPKNTDGVNHGWKCPSKEQETGKKHRSQQCQALAEKKLYIKVQKNVRARNTCQEIEIIIMDKNEKKKKPSGIEAE